jgi:hypothetical protein
MDVWFEGRILEFKDCKIGPAGVTAWDWGDTGTHHQPGIQPADLEGLLEDTEAVILSRGMLLRLGTTPEVIKLLEDLGLPYFVEQTQKAARRYNRLAEAGTRVVGLFHSTC